MDRLDGGISQRFGRGGGRAQRAQSRGGALGPAPAQSVEKPPGVRGPQPPEALIGFGDMRVKSAKSLA